MSVKFFSQFLIEQGEVDAGHVFEAIQLMERENRNLGQIAVDEGMLSEAEAGLVHDHQRRTDRRFGDLAVELGLISSGQLVDLLRIQQQGRLRMGEALVWLGHLPADRLTGLLDQFKIDQEPYQTGSIDLPDALASNRIASILVQLLPKLTLRIAHLHSKVGDATPFESTPDFARFRVAVPIQGARGLEATLLGDRDFCEKLVAGCCGTDARNLDPEAIADGLAEFLSILAGNTIGILARDGLAVELGPPDLEAELYAGYVFDLAVDTGRAALVLTPL